MVPNNLQQGYGYSQSTPPAQVPRALSQDHRHTDSPSAPYAASNVYFAERIKEEIDVQVIEESLSVTNYKKKYHNLVCWEEKEHIEILENKWVLIFCQ